MTALGALFVPHRRQRVAGALLASHGRRTSLENQWKSMKVWGRGYFSSSENKLFTIFSGGVNPEGYKLFLSSGINSMRASAHWLHEVQRCSALWAWCSLQRSLMSCSRIYGISPAPTCGKDQWKHGAPIRTQLAHARLVHVLVRFLPPLHWMMPTCTCSTMLQRNVNSIFLAAQLCLDLMSWWGAVPSGFVQLGGPGTPGILLHFSSLIITLCACSLSLSALSRLWRLHLNLSSLSRGCSVRSGIRIFHAGWWPISPLT